MKYVMFTRTIDSSLGKIKETFPVIFPDILNHIDIVKSICQEIKHEKIEAISAGFLTRDLHAYGTSVSLDMKPHENDDMIIDNLIRLNMVHID